MCVCVLSEDSECEQSVQACGGLFLKKNIYIYVCIKETIFSWKR
jgi:hypothetical protein